jgi:hypothetical protein
MVLKFTRLHGYVERKEHLTEIGLSRMQNFVTN